MTETPSHPRQRAGAGSRNRLLAGIVVVVLSMPGLTGCATLAGLPFSPLTGAIGAGIVHNDCSGWDVLWGYPLGLIAGFFWGPVIEISVGLKADIGCMGSGAYGQNDTPGFFDVFDPFGYGLSQPEKPAESPKP